MATYAAFKHVELYNVGKTKKRVLRPPGGVTTDIFAGEMPSTPRNGKNRMASNIFSVEKDSVKNNVRQGIHRFYFIGDQPRRGQKSVDSHNRLFGQSDRPFTPAKNHMKSNIPLGHNGNLTNGKSNGHHVNGNSDTGSLSSSTSSIASSNDNYKMNGFSKTVFRKMSNSETENSISNNPPSEPLPPPTPTVEKDDDTVSLLSTSTVKTQVEVAQNIDTKSMSSKKQEETKAEEEKNVSEEVEETKVEDEPKVENEPKVEEPKKTESKKKDDKPKKTQIPVFRNTRDMARNPITGVGLEADTDRPRKNQCKKDGNPITGEGYKGAEINTSIPSLNGANQVINKNRIPPGGFSSGLW